jgi:hypothetical protein
MIRGFANSCDTLNLPSTPTSSNMFTFGHSFSSFPYTMSLFSEALLAFLNTGNISDEDATSVLEEYAWSSIISGKRVREYCEDLTEVISKVSHPFAKDLQLISSSTSQVLCKDYFTLVSWRLSFLLSESHQPTSHHHLHYLLPSSLQITYPASPENN